MEISPEVTNFLYTVISTNASNEPYDKKFDTRLVYVFIKHLLDGEPPTHQASSDYELDRLSRLFDIIPEELKPAADKLLSAWKVKVFSAKDPDQQSLIPETVLDESKIGTSIEKTIDEAIKESQDTLSSLGYV